MISLTLPISATRLPVLHHSPSGIAFTAILFLKSLDLFYQTLKVSSTFHEPPADTLDIESRSISGTMEFLTIVETCDMNPGTVRESLYIYLTLVLTGYRT